MNELPGYVSIVFILTTFVTIGFLLRAIKAVGLDRLPALIAVFLLPLWLFFQAALALGGFYQDTSSFPPRLILCGILPAVLLIGTYFIFFRAFIGRLPLRLLTLLHVVRVPVEIVLYWLFVGGLVPRMVTFEGLNFDIVSGILSPIVAFAAIGRGRQSSWMLIVYNTLGLLLLANIVSIAAMSLPSPMQQLNFDQPNRGVLLFPYIWLPTVIVPIVLFSHLAAFLQVLRPSRNL